MRPLTLPPLDAAAAFCEQLQAVVARSRARGRVAIVLCDNLRTHMAAGATVVRQLLTDLEGHLQVVYTPAYDPDANRIGMLWRHFRREVTHCELFKTMDALVDAATDFFARRNWEPRTTLSVIGSNAA
jgi:putative transposase